MSPFGLSKLKILNYGFQFLNIIHPLIKLIHICSLCMNPQNACAAAAHVSRPMHAHMPPARALPPTHVCSPSTRAPPCMHTWPKHVPHPTCARTPHPTWVAETR